MTYVHSSCCKFEVGTIENARAYCYVCGKVHEHGHLDLRHLRTILLGRVVRRHSLNWNEIEKDTKKFGGMQKGVFCQSVLTEVEALCSHGNPITFDGKPLRLHMCYGADDRKDDDQGGVGNCSLNSDLSVQQGLDFTSDLCTDVDSIGFDPSVEQLGVAEEAELRANEFAIGNLLKYNPKRVAFELV